MPHVRKNRPKKICKSRYFYKIFSNLFLFLRRKNKLENYEAGHDCNS